MKLSPWETYPPIPPNEQAITRYHEKECKPVLPKLLTTGKRESRKLWLKWWWLKTWKWKKSCTVEVMFHSMSSLATDIQHFSKKSSEIEVGFTFKLTAAILALRNRGYHKMLNVHLAMVKKHVLERFCTVV